MEGWRGRMERGRRKGLGRALRAIETLGLIGERGGERKPWTNQTNLRLPSKPLDTAHLNGSNLHVGSLGPVGTPSKPSL